MKWLSAKVLVLVALLICSVNVSATDIDKAYSKSGQIPTIGQVMRSTFNLSGYNKSYALVVGVSDFDHFNSLQTKDDPIKIKDYLLDEAGFDHVHLLTGSHVTRQRLRALMVDFFPNRMGAQDRFLFYWSGHGVTDTRNGKNFGLLPFEKSRQDQFSSMLDMDSLSQWDKRLPSKQTLYLLDACFSGYAGISGQSSRQKQSIQQFGIPSRQVLTAGRKGEQTIVLNDRSSSVFTTAVLEGLRGKADYFKDNVVTASELSNFVRSRVRELSAEKWKRSITPSLGRFYEGGEGEFFFLTKNGVKQSEERRPEGSTSVSAQSGSKPQASSRISVSHQHNGRPHSHVLPASSQSHKHNGGQSSQGRAVKPIVNLTHTFSNSPKKPFEPKVVFIPAGRFSMGCVIGRDDILGVGCVDWEKPVKQVNIAAFRIGKTEVTFDEWDACTHAGVCIKANDEGWGRGKRPVINVSWEDVRTYIRWLNQQTGNRYQLPSEAQWEYAARSNRNTAFPWGNVINCNNANYGSVAECETDRTLPVASYSANAFGLHDTVGNVWEWTRDCWANASTGASLGGSARTVCAGSLPVIRGGSWDSGSWGSRLAHRFFNSSTARSHKIGFRLIRVH